MLAHPITHAILPALLMTVLPAAASVSCTAVSGERRVPVLELYTSEGCDSCPPVDRWVSQLPARGLGLDRLVILGFHVDYWDYLGWKDPYARRRFSERQRSLNARNGSRVIHTPQLLLNGRDYRRSFTRDDAAERISAINQRTSGASITLRANTSGPEVEVDITVALTGNTLPATPAQAFLALYENGLSTHVRAGENRGKHLKHDFVVRDLAGPFSVIPAKRTDFRHAFDLPTPWKASNLGIAAYVQEPATGDVLQALALPACR